jgi:hypothetical protein
MYAKIVNKIAENPARYLEELMDSARRNEQRQQMPAVLS